MKDKKRIRQIYNSKIFWAIVSLVLSLIIWSYVSGLDGSSTEKTFSGVQVQFEGESTLQTQRGLAITNVDTTTVTIKVRGSRANIGKLNTSDITAVIDVSKITQAGDLEWTYDIVFPDDVDKNDLTIVSRNPDAISFSVVKTAKKNVPVKGSFEGTIADDCVAEELVFDPVEIQVEGPENIVNSIDHAWISFGEGMKIDATYIADLEFTLKDKDGNVIPEDSLTVSVKTVNVIQPILKTREIPLEVKIINGGGVTADDCKITISPKTVSVAADSRLIDDKESIIIGTIDLASFQSTYEGTFTIDLDEGIENLTGTTEATVTVEISDVKTRTVKVTNISCKNCTGGFYPNIETESVEVTLRSRDEDALNAVSADDIEIVVDLADYGSTTGKVIANGTVIINGTQNVGAIGEVKVTITILSS